MFACAAVAFSTVAVVAASAYAQCSLSMSQGGNRETVEEYELKMSLRVPRIYDNMQSLGSRKYQTQSLKGRLLVVHSPDGGEPTIEINGLENRTNKIGGKRVTYETVADGVLWHCIGDNRKGEFQTSSVSFRIDANPSYNIGGDEPDNTLILVLSGKGSHKTISGYAAGQIGCGCGEYGHISPTRIMGAGGAPGAVVDIASVWGTWKAKLKRTYTRAVAFDEDGDGDVSGGGSSDNGGLSDCDDGEGICP